MMREPMNEMDKKAYEIAYALCRLALKSGEPLGGILSSKGLHLLAAVALNDIETAERLTSVLGYFIKLGAGLDQVSQGNADLLIGQLNLLTDMLSNDLDAAVNETSRSAEDVDLSEIFSGNADEPLAHPAIKDDLSEKPPVKIAGYSATSLQRKETNEIQEVKSFDDTKNTDEESSFSPLISSDIRQSEILDLIRQSGNCRIKDLQEMFPRCSERTLRYDIESLIGRGLIERIGAGSATAYQPID